MVVKCRGDSFNYSRFGLWFNLMVPENVFKSDWWDMADIVSLFRSCDQQIRETRVTIWECSNLTAMLMIALSSRSLSFWFFPSVFCTDNKNNDLWLLWIVVYSSSVFHLWRTWASWCFHGEVSRGEKVQLCSPLSLWPRRVITISLEHSLFVNCDDLELKQVCFSDCCCLLFLLGDCCWPIRWARRDYVICLFIQSGASEFSRKNVKKQN